MSYGGRTEKPGVTAEGGQQKASAWLRLVWLHELGNGFLGRRRVLRSDVARLSASRVQRNSPVELEAPLRPFCGRQGSGTGRALSLQHGEQLGCGKSLGFKPQPARQLRTGPGGGKQAPFVSLLLLERVAKSSPASPAALAQQKAGVASAPPVSGGTTTGTQRLC